MCSNYSVSRKTVLTRAGVLLLAIWTLFGARAAPQLQKQVGSFVIAVSTTPDPLQVGPDDVNVTVQKASDHSAVLDAQVEVRFQKKDVGNIVEIVAPAPRVNVSNKPVYKAQATFPSIGSWRLQVEVNAHNESAAFASNVTVVPRQADLLPHWRYFVVIGLALIALLWIQWFRRKRRFNRSPARP